METKKSPNTATIRIRADIDKTLFKKLDRLEGALTRIKHELLEVKRLSRETGIDPRKLTGVKQRNRG